MVGLTRKFRSLINRKTNLKPIINDSLSKDFNGESQGWLGLKERVVKTVFVFTAVWTSACSAVLLAYMQVCSVGVCLP